MSLPDVVPATPADRERVVDTVVAAFAADPAFRFFFQDEVAFGAQAAAFAGHLFDRRVRLGTVWVTNTPRDQRGASLAMWDGPTAEPDAEWPALTLPADTLARLERYDKAVHAALPATPHWYLGVLATHPGHAGRRWGRVVMAAGIEVATAAGLPAYVETSNPANVELYRRAGWSVVESLAVDRLPVWVMMHPAGA